MFSFLLGVAFFRSLFPNDYYAYNTGELMSVKTSEKKIVGKNLLLNSLASKTVNGITITKNSDGSFVLNGTATGDVYERLAANMAVPTGEYILTGNDNGAWNTYYLYMTIVGTSGDPINRDYQKAAVQLNSSLLYNCTLTVKNGTTVNNQIVKPMLRYADTDSSYEPYTEKTYPLSNVDLRGLYKLNNGVLYADGDEYTADGNVKRKYAYRQITSADIVGEYLDNTNNQYLASYTPTDAPKMTGDINAVGNAICNNMPVLSQNMLFNNVGSSICAMSNVARFRLTIVNCTTLEQMKTWINNNPIYVVYELATETTETTTPYTELQNVYADGTEEFIDSRDVAIPVGHESEYREEVNAVPVSVLGTDESNRTTASRAYTKGEYYYQNGKMFKVTADNGIASGATFTVGTNCQQTTLFAELKAAQN